MGWHIEQGEKIGYWVAGYLDRAYAADRSNALGLVRNGEIVAGVIYEQWTGRSLVAHIAVIGRMNREFVRAIFDYAFNVCDVEKAIVTIASNNAKSIKLVENMGFTEETRIKDAIPGGDMLIYSLTKPLCRFLGSRYEQKHSEAACCA